MRFSGCRRLTHVTIPPSVTSIARSAFSQCGRLTSIDVGFGNQNYASTEGILFNSSTTELILCPEGRTGTYVIPHHVAMIGDSAFARCRLLTRIVIPDSVVRVGDSAFSGCEMLSSIKLSSRLVSLGNDALNGCNRLAKIEIPETVRSIGQSAFAGCHSLEEVIIPEGVKSNR